MNILKPQALKTGDIIGVIAPASPATEEKTMKAKASLEKLGFRVKMGKSCYLEYGYLAGSDDIRAYDVNRMFLDDDVKGIICLKGGYGTPRILGLLDYEAIKKHPKVFIGYSDITAIHIALHQMCNMVTFHGPMAGVDIADELDEFSRISLFNCIKYNYMKDNNQPISITNPYGEAIQCMNEGIARGKMIGGNLTLIISSLGTPYEIDTKDKILFIEEVGERPYKVDRLLTQLYNAGKLHDASGIVLGDFKNCVPLEDEVSQSLEEVFEDLIKPLNKPTIYNVKAGHCSPMITLPFGLDTYMDADRSLLRIEERGTINGR